LPTESESGKFEHGKSECGTPPTAQRNARAVRSRIMQFHANSGSTSVFADDYYQIIFEAEEDADDLPYLLIQRQFEDPDDDLCYVETQDEKYTGHFLLRRVEFTSQRLSIELDRPKDNLLSVTFTMAPSDFEEAPRVVKIITG
jgi:hypothetical protein